MRFLLTAGLVVIGLWLAVAWPAWHLAGPRGLAGSAAAGVLCLVSMALGYGGQRWARGRGLSWELGAILLGMLFRMLLVLAAVAVLYGTRVFDFVSFVLWVVIFYVVLLAVEAYYAYQLFRHSRP